MSQTLIELSKWNSKLDSNHLLCMYSSMMKNYHYVHLKPKWDGIDAAIWFIKTTAMTNYQSAHATLPVLT